MPLGSVKANSENTEEEWSQKHRSRLNLAHAMAGGQGKESSLQEQPGSLRDATRASRHRAAPALGQAEQRSSAHSNGWGSIPAHLNFLLTILSSTIHKHWAVTHHFHLQRAPKPTTNPHDHLLGCRGCWKTGTKEKRWSHWAQLLKGNVLNQLGRRQQCWAPSHKAWLPLRFFGAGRRPQPQVFPPKPRFSFMNKNWRAEQLRK